MLDGVGIDAEEEHVYRALLRAPESTIRELSASTGRTEHSVRRSVGRLEEFGLLSRTARQPVRLIPTRPDVAVEVLVARRQADLARAQVAAKAMVADMASPTQYRPENLIEVVVGQSAIAARFAQLLNNTESELLALDRPPYATPPEEADPLVKQLLKKNVTVRGIYSPDSMARPGAVDLAYAAAQEGEESRVHPSVPIKLIVSDRSVALLPIAMETSRGSALVVRETALIEALSQLFFLLWEQAVPVVPGSAQAEVPTVNERLLTMLAAGMKDDAIGRHLGISTRTVGRRVAELLDHLQARTRFEAGVHAERRQLLGGGQPSSASADSLSND